MTNEAIAGKLNFWASCLPGNRADEAALLKQASAAVRAGATAPEIGVQMAAWSAIASQAGQPAFARDLAEAATYLTSLEAAAT